MSNFGNEERELLNESILAYFQDNLSFEQQRSRARQAASANAQSYDRSHWQNFASLGWTGIGISEADGGAGGGMVELGILMAAAGRHLCIDPLLTTLVTGASVLQAGGAENQHEQLRAIASGELLLAMCHSEPDSGYDRSTVKTRATKSAAGYLLNGAKAFAVYASVADQLLVSARDDNNQLALFLVAPETNGLTLTPAATLDERPGAALVLNDVNVSESARIGSDQSDMVQIVDQAIDRGALAVCAEAVGAMQAVTDQTIEYLKSRQQFGQPLAKLQVLQHRLVDMSIACEETRCVVHAALQACDQQRDGAQLLGWQAKVQTARAARFVGGQAIQLHGGMGMTDELAIGHYYKRLVMCETMFGDAQWYLAQLAQTEAEMNRVAA